jgi:hypothetical protein
MAAAHRVKLIFTLYDGEECVDINQGDSSVE